ncbi:exodeoxyribonuclease V subunit beta [Pedobacter arcticus]|uniref:exodeoxyribonuclease V subunit beta n=1 Tax=Pedobacter arcticus TaxID=752140 RepID=UPI0002D29EA7|nr:exodeoxyribonuclease V subunit beta [Pedobacter arcticus]
MPKEFLDFNASNVELAGSNLIEASAGTGKTYSIAVLVLRLLLEKNIAIREILMVTFTKAAVAELEERIRLFVRLAYKVAQGETIKDATITALVKNVSDKSPQEIEELLKEAILFLDETSVLTIHSFCQQTLGEFAFETDQLFGIDLMQDGSAILEDETNKFWRQFVTTIPTEMLGILINDGLAKGAIKNKVRSHLSGQNYYHYKVGENYTMCDADYEYAAKEIDLKQQEIDKHWESIVDYCQNNKADLVKSCEGNAYCRKDILPYINDAESFIEAVNSKRDKANVQKTLPEIINFLAELDELKKQKIAITKKVIVKITCNGIQQISAGIAYYKNRYNQISFDDLISKLHHALVKRESTKLVDCLQQKYKAVFIDEFQDTDRLQYEIFEKAFGTNTILFYIGDPKQSIYAFRKADIYTYFEAKNAVDKKYGMNQNYRSSTKLIDAMNTFFKPEENFDTFHFGNASLEQRINYLEVASPSNNKKGNLLYNNSPTTPIEITECAKNDGIYEAVATQIITLFNDKNFQIEADGVTRGILPKDIGILIRNKAAGIKIKKLLTRHGIPAITIDDGKVLQSEEALYLLYFLQAITDISGASINKALLSPFTGFTADNILALDHDLIIELFRRYKLAWDKDGIYTALKAFTKDFSIESQLLNAQNSDGERTITNLYQLIELLHKTQSRKNLNSLELISWLKRGIEGMETDGDEFEQRIENDEDAIKIVTIHKSKGLEYKIVFAPTLDLVTNTKHTDCSFRSENGDYISAEKADLTPEELAEVVKQAEQENRRLVYVAITRAVSQCYIYKSNYYKTSSLSFFTDTLKKLETKLIRFKSSDDLAIPAGYKYKKTGADETTHPIKPIDFKLSQENWRRMSYSMLRADHPMSIKLKQQTELKGYDDFIFNQLRKGAKTGNMLHFIFENIHFHDNSKWPNVIEQAIQRFVPQQENVYQPMLMEMLHHVLGATISIDDESFKLSEVNSFKCIHELEFDFNVENFIPGNLNQLSTTDILVDAKPFPILEGVMNGKIDLFFEHNNKYYVLDWKSNFLGDSVADYEQGNLNLAMNESNYHLQYLIYALAIKKYLESRLPNFNYKYQFGGVIYLFLRGIRSDLQTGIFTAKPDISTIGNLNARLSAQ